MMHWDRQEEATPPHPDPPPSHGRTSQKGGPEVKVSLGTSLKRNKNEGSCSVLPRNKVDILVSEENTQVSSDEYKTIVMRKK